MPEIKKGPSEIALKHDIFGPKKILPFGVISSMPKNISTKNLSPTAANVSAGGRQDLVQTLSDDADRLLQDDHVGPKNRTSALAIPRPATKHARPTTLRYRENKI